MASKHLGEGEGRAGRGRKEEGGSEVDGVGEGEGQLARLEIQDFLFFCLLHFAFFIASRQLLLFFCLFFCACWQHGVYTYKQYAHAIKHSLSSPQPEGLPACMLRACTPPLLPA